MSLQKRWRGATGLAVVLCALLSLSVTGSVGAAPARSSDEPVLGRIWERLERLWAMVDTGSVPGGGLPEASEPVTETEEPEAQPPTRDPQIGSEIDPNG